VSAPSGSLYRTSLFLPLMSF